jgi:hypothetical protein
VPSNLIYEVECELDPDIVADYDAWLPGHVQDVLACAGFLGAAIEAPEMPPGTRQRRIIRYELESAAALDHYLENEATRLRTETAQRFGGRVRCERRALKPRHDLVPASRAPVTCLECGAPVTGAWCARCGQSAGVHVLSMKEVAGDVTHSLLHLDSRVWRTLRLLVLRPGELTREFIAGRHQRYLPPFRLYLAISVLFFALSALLPGFSLVGTDAGGNAVIAPVVIEGRDGTAARTQAALEELPAELGKELAAAGVDAGAIGQAASGTEPCTPDLPPVFGVDWNDSLRRACLKIRADGGAALAERFAATAPKLMFLFLPLMAAVALLFYWKPRRLYAEHLVLFLHNHAFTFLLILVTQIVSAITLLKLPFIGVLGFVNFLLFLYLFHYIYRSMRLVYGEGRLKTALKFTALVAIYFLLLGVTMLAGLLYSMLSL